MASEVVDGLTLPIRLAGHPALDFCNTRAGWGEAEPKEYLTSYAHLLVWCREAGVLPATAVPALRRTARRDRDAAAAVLADAVRLRDAAYALLLGHPTEADWAQVRRHANAARCAGRLEPAADGSGATAVWVLPADTLAAPLLGIAGSLADLLTMEPRLPVAACPGRGCGWLFADPHRRRRWCSMALCGNRAKARRHAERHRA